MLGISTIPVLSAAHLFLQMLSMFTWRSSSHLNEPHTTLYIVLRLLTSILLRSFAQRNITFLHSYSHRLCWKQAIYICGWLHGEGRMSPATPRNKNTDQPSRGQLQEAVRTL